MQTNLAVFKQCEERWVKLVAPGISWKAGVENSYAAEMFEKYSESAAIEEHVRSVFVDL